MLGAASKPSNVGFLYRIFARQANGNLLKAEVYIESFSEKIELISVESMNFMDNFAALKTDDNEINKVAKALRSKVNLEENSNYLVKKAEAKSFLYGNVYKLQIEISLA